jgi:hypothetical protein
LSTQRPPPAPQEEQYAKERADNLRNDVVLGWFFKWLDNVGELVGGGPKK